MSFTFRAESFSRLKVSQGWNCLSTPGLKISQGWNCLGWKCLTAETVFWSQGCKFLVVETVSGLKVSSRLLQSYYRKFLHTIKVGKSLLQVSGGGASKIASGLVTSRFSSIWPKYEPFKLWFIRNLSHVQKVNKSINHSAGLGIALTRSHNNRLRL